MVTEEKLSYVKNYRISNDIDYVDRFEKIMKSRQIDTLTLRRKAKVHSSCMSILFGLNSIPSRECLARLCRVLQIEPEFFTLSEHSLLEIIYKTKEHYCFNYYADFEILFGYNPVRHFYVNNKAS